MKEGETISILVVDDHHIVRMGISAIIGNAPDLAIIAEANDGQEGIALYLKHRPCITLMDLRMPLMDGIEATERIIAACPTARIIMFTNYGRDEDVFRAFRAGAAGYLLKSTPCCQIVEAIRRVHAGGQCVPTAIAAKHSRRISAMQFSERQIEVLRLIVKGKTNREIAMHLNLTEHTAKWYLKQLLGKLGAKDRTEAAYAALSRGIVALE